MTPAPEPPAACQCAELRAEVARWREVAGEMKSALEAARHSGYCATSMKVSCPLCGRHPDEEHRPDECLIAAALARYETLAKEGDDA